MRGKTVAEEVRCKNKMVETRASGQQESAVDMAAEMAEAAVERAKRKAVSELDAKLPTRMKKVKRKSMLGNARNRKRRPSGEQPKKDTGLAGWRETSSGAEDSCS